MANYETQVVVIAAGPSGLSAAVQAAEDGAEVIVLEKAAAVGGAANMGMGPLGIGTKYQKKQMEDITVEKAFNMFISCLILDRAVRRDNRVAGGHGS
jgi:fumarate reductase flavoprotein subunit